MESLISTFHIDWKLIIAQVVNFAIVFFVLYKFAIKPLGKLMTERSRAIKQGLDDARDNERLIRETKAAYDAQLAEARKVAQALLATVKKEGEAKKRVLMESTEVQVGLMLDAGERELARQKKAMLEDAKRELGEMVILATAKVLDGTVTKEIDQKLIEQSIKELES